MKSTDASMRMDGEMSQPTSSVQKAFQPRFEEIQRRREGVERCQVESKPCFSTTSESAPTLFELPDQNIVVYSLSHRAVRPYSLSGHGSVRIIGIFPDIDEAMAHGKRVHDLDPGSSIFACRAREWIGALSTQERQQDPAVHDEVIAEMVSGNVRDRVSDEHDFLKSVQRNRDGDIEPSPPETDDMDMTDEIVGEDDNIVNNPVPDGGVKAVRTLPAVVKVDGQRFAIVSFLYDEAKEDREFLFKVYGCFDDVKEADAWVRNVASKRVADVHIDIVSTCSWVCPARMAMSKAGKEIFRHEELDNIMKFHAAEPARVVEYKEQLNQV